MKYDSTSIQSSIQAIRMCKTNLINAKNCCNGMSLPDDGALRSLINNIKNSLDNMTNNATRIESNMNALIIRMDNTEALNKSIASSLGGRSTANLKSSNKKSSRILL